MFFSIFVILGVVYLLAILEAKAQFFPEEKKRKLLFQEDWATVQIGWLVLTLTNWGRLSIYSNLIVFRSLGNSFLLRKQDLKGVNFKSYWSGREVLTIYTKLSTLPEFKVRVSHARPVFELVKKMIK